MEVLRQQPIISGLEEPKECLMKEESCLLYTSQPGDIKYVDQPDANGNCDGIINTNDRVYMGYPEDPEIVYGFGPSMKYRCV